jgi:predicted DNA-binding ArsR family transcriptional regulator
MLILCQQLFRKIATNAVSGLAISHEDLADLLSLKDNADEEIEDYVEAVQVCRVIPKVSSTSSCSLEGA